MIESINKYIGNVSMLDGWSVEEYGQEMIEIQ